MLPGHWELLLEFQKLQVRLFAEIVLPDRYSMDCDELVAELAPSPVHYFLLFLSIYVSRGDQQLLTSGD